jgi:hypothetical protein
MTLMQALDNVTYPAMVIVFVVMTSLWNLSPIGLLGLQSISRNTNF